MTGGRVCAGCGTAASALWRRSADGARRLCNSCGLREAATLPPRVPIGGGGGGGGRARRWVGRSRRWVAAHVLRGRRARPGGALGGARPGKHGVRRGRPAGGAR